MFGFLRKKQTTDGCGLQLSNFTDLQDNVLKIASKEVLFCSENDRVIDALASMLAGVRRIPVVGQTGEISGIISATDVLDFVGGGDKNRLFTNTGLSASVKKIMSPCIQCLSGNDSIPVALEIFKSNGKPIQPVVHEKRLSGVVSESDMAYLISKQTGIRVSEIMSRKPITALEAHSVYDVAKMLCRGPYRRLPVANNGVVIGIVTPYDILSYLNRNEALNTLKFEHSPVKNIMNQNVATVLPESDVHEAVRVMKLKKVSGLPVVDEDLDMVGMITKRDIIEAMCC